MRRLHVVSILFGMTTLAPVAHAQNYVRTQSYNNPDVMVNMDTLGAMPNGGLVPTPVY